MFNWFRSTLQGFALKATQLAIVPQWVKVKFLDPLFWRLVKDGYSNAVVAACISAYQFAIPEPPLLVTVPQKDGTLLPDPQHPVRLLFDSPNETMNEAEYWDYVATYVLLGGNCYAHKLRNEAGMVVGLVPYHDGHINPVPYNGTDGRGQFISHYIYSVDGRTPTEIRREDIIHYKWPAPDPAHPWKGISPLVILMKEIDTDCEATRYLYAFLKNDASPNTVVTVPAETKTDTSVLKAKWDERFGGGSSGDRRGGAAFVKGDVKVHQIGSTIKDMDLTAFRAVPEARICAVLKVPPEIAGVNVGLAHSTENNLAAADIRFTNRTLIPLWRQFADTTQRSLQLEPYYEEFTLTFDLNQVAALKTEKAKQVAQSLLEYQAGAITKDEFRKDAGRQVLAEQVIATNQLRETVGGVGVLLTIQQAVQAGTLDRDAAINTAIEVFGFDKTKADSIIPKAPKQTPTPTEQV